MKSNALSMSHALSTLVFGSFAIGGCASTTPGARPLDMTAAQHEQAAWSSESNPAAQSADSEKYRKMATDHRAAARSLRDAETRDCVGVSESDRDISPFHHRLDILTVETTSGRAAPQYDGELGSQMHLTGAVVTFRAIPGMTVEWLQKVVDCHVSRNNSVANDMPEMSYCPLAVKGARATVSSARGGFAVAVEAFDQGAIQEVVRRAQALKNPG